MLSLGLGALEEVGELAFIWDDYKNTRPSHRHSTFSSNNVLGKDKREKEKKGKDILSAIVENDTLSMFFWDRTNIQVSAPRGKTQRQISLLLSVWY